jgi:integrase
MADIRKRTGSKGTTYQVRYPSPGTKSGYAYATFKTRKEALAFREDGGTKRTSSVRSSEIRTLDAAITKWLDVCEKEGRDGRDPVTVYTHKTYAHRAEIMRAYGWTKELCELQTPDIIEFRSWLLQNHSRDLAKKVLSSFRSVIREMAMRGHIASNVASGVSVRTDSRYDSPIEIPTPADVAALLAAADRLANSKNRKIAKSWQRYRPMLYLAADSGMRPGEVLSSLENLEGCILCG